MSLLPRPLKWPPIFPLMRGLVLWLPFDERSGERAFDRSRVKNHGALTGLDWMAGLRGGCLQFGTANEYVLVDDHTTLDGALDWSMAMQICNLGQPVAVTVPRITARAGYTFELVMGNGYVVSSNVIGYYYPSSWVDTGVSMPTDGWSWLGIGYDASPTPTIHTYLNGVLEDSQVVSALDLSGDLYIGDAAVGGEPCSMKLQNFMVFDRLLTAEEFKRLCKCEVFLARA